jgi:hypothetical protein
MMLVVNTAASLKRCSDPAIECQHDLSPHRNLAEGLRVTNGVEAVSSSAAGHVDSIDGLQESCRATTSHGAEDDDSCFFTLKIVDGGHP